jgi:glycosyltransferase involved in cell wall biosynthesis
VHLTVVGKGEEREAAQELAKGLQVTFAGFQHNCMPSYRSSDVLVLSSTRGLEGLPQVPLEAMAMGLPCLASDISSILEIDAESGALATYSQGDIGDLVENLSKFSGTPSTLVEPGRTGRLEIEKRFTEAAVAGANLEQFCSMAERLPIGSASRGQVKRSGDLFRQ